jgi:hypothetical protein
VRISDEYSKSNQLALVDTLAKIVTTVKEVKNGKESVDPKVSSRHDNTSLGLAQQDTTEKRQGLREDQVDATLKSYAFTLKTSKKRPRNSAEKEGMTRREVTG